MNGHEDAETRDDGEEGSGRRDDVPGRCAQCEDGQDVRPPTDVDVTRSEAGHIHPGRNTVQYDVDGCERGSQGQSHLAGV
jgi:hypothetical protein